MAVDLRVDNCRFSGEAGIACWISLTDVTFVGFLPRGTGSPTGGGAETRQKLRLNEMCDVVGAVLLTRQFP